MIIVILGTRIMIVIVMMMRMIGGELAQNW